MEDFIFDAKAARELTDGKSVVEINKQLEEIKIAAASGESHLFLMYHIGVPTVNALMLKGFQVEQMDSLAIQKDGLYFKISW